MDERKKITKYHEYYGYLEKIYRHHHYQAISMAVHIFHNFEGQIVKFFR